MSVDYLWDADGPARGSRGVCDDQAAARAKAERCMKDDGAPRALIRAATPGVDVGGLDDGWCPTGDAWLAEFDPGGDVTWVPVSLAEPPDEPGG